MVSHVARHHLELEIELSSVRNQMLLKISQGPNLDSLIEGFLYSPNEQPGQLILDVNKPRRSALKFETIDVILECFNRE